jgi:hypothetical protein
MALLDQPMRLSMQVQPPVFPCAAFADKGAGVRCLVSLRR